MSQPASVGRPGYIYTRLINRPLGGALARLLYPTDLHPNQVTGASFGLAMIGSAIVVIAAATPHNWLILPAYLGLAVGYVLDSADGQLARARGQASPGGLMLDHGLDLIRIVAMNFAFGYYLLLAYGDGSATLTGAWFIVFLNISGQATSLFSASLRDIVVGKIDEQWGENTRGVKRALRGLLNVRDQGFLMMLVLLMPFQAVFFVIYALIGVINFASAVLGLGRAIRLAGQVADRRTARPPGCR